MPVSIGYTTADITSLKAIATTDLVTGYLRFVISVDSWFKYNSTSSSTANNVNIIAPNSGVGRWFQQKGYTLTTDLTDFSEAVDDRVNALFANSSTISKSYNDAGNSFSLDIINNSITNTHINTSAAIAQSKIANLTTDLATLTSSISTINTTLSGKANTSHTHTSSDVTDFNEAVDDRVSVLCVAGTNMAITYNDTTGQLTFESTASGGGGGGGFDWDTVDATTWDASY